MVWDQVMGTEVDRAALRVRLVAVALGTTIVLLGAGSGASPAALLLAAYAGVAVAVRFLGARWPALPIERIAIGLDALVVSALVVILPFDLPVWTLYLVPVATAALRLGPAGVLGIAALSVLGYDLALGMRGAAMLATDLWPVQLLLGAGLIAAELTRVRQREAEDRDRLRRRDIALRDLAGADDLGGLLARLTRHLVDDGASGAWIQRTDGDTVLIEHERGIVPEAAGRPGAAPPPSDAILVALAGEDEPLLLGATFRSERSDRERRVASARDLAADVRPLVSAALARADARADSRVRSAFDATLPDVVAASNEAALVAAAVLAAGRVAGPAAIVRYADGSVSGGDLETEAAVELARGIGGPAIVRRTPHPAWSDVPLRAVAARSAAVVPLGSGLGLVAASARRLRATELALLVDLGAIFAERRRSIRDHEDAVAVASAQDATIAEQRDALRLKDEAVAAALHELRTPLSSVDGYAQLMSRHLDSARRQIAQLEHVLMDLQRPFEGSPASGLDLQEVDLGREVREAVSRLRLTTGAEIDLRASAEPLPVRIDPSRFAQVLDNLFANAVKYSAPGSPIDVALDASESEIVIAVTDAGEGLRSEDVDRVFERGYRAPHGGVAVAGQGLGLAISKLIVVAHGGRIWATSDGPGRGSTFFVALRRTG